jgi:hypothetical protein
VCARLHEEFSRREPEPDAGEHLPAELIARWSKLEPVLQGREREMVMNHLARCDDCRQDLEVLGFSMAPAAPRLKPSAQRVIRIVGASAGRWRQRVFAGWAVVASAAALVLALRTGTPVPVQIAQPVDMGAPPVALTPDAGSAAPPSGRTTLNLSAPFELRDVTRGGDVDTVVYHVDPADVYFEVDISRLVEPITGSHPIDLVLTDPTGMETRQSSTHDALRGRPLIVTNNGMPPATGCYRLEITEKDPGSPIVRTYYFRVVSEPRH